VVGVAQEVALALYFPAEHTAQSLADPKLEVQLLAVMAVQTLAKG